MPSSLCTRVAARLFISSFCTSAPLAKDAIVVESSEARKAQLYFCRQLSKLRACLKCGLLFPIELLTTLVQLADQVSSKERGVKVERLIKKRVVVVGTGRKEQATKEDEKEKKL